MQGYYPQQQYAAPPRSSVAPNGSASTYGHQGYPQRTPQPVQAPPRTTVPPVPAPAHLQPTDTAERRRVSTVMLDDGDGQYRAAKKRKPTDRSLPSFAPSSTSAIALPASVEATNATLAALSSSYGELQRIERKLDWTISRKRVEYAEQQSSSALNVKATRIRKTLRVRASNTCSNQLWQGAGAGEGEGAVDFDTGEGVPSWKLCIEGWLLDDDETKAPSDTYRFTSLLRRVVVDADRSDMAGQEHVHAQWERKAESPAQDGLTFEGQGSSNLSARISLSPLYFPERFTLAPELGGALGMTEGSRADVISALWTYIRKNNLLDPEDRRMIRANAYFTRLLTGGATLQRDLKIPFQNLPDLMAKHMGRIPPVKLDYTVVVEKDPSDSAQTWDLPIDIDDPLRTEIADFVASSTQQSNDTTLSQQLTKLDDTISEAAAKVHNTRTKRDTLAAFSADPVSFLRVWLSSQSADIDQLLSVGDRSHQSLSGVTAEDLRHADFYRAPWVADAINLHQGRLFTKHVENAVAAGSAQGMGARR